MYVHVQFSGAAVVLQSINLVNDKVRLLSHKYVETRTWLAERFGPKVMSSTTPEYAIAS